MMDALNKSLFWIHISIIVALLAAGLWVTSWTMFLVIVAHRIHVWMFDGCLISKIQQKTGGLDADTNFLQMVTEKIWGKQLSIFQAQLADYCIVATAFALTLIRR
jgi:hypothetical protein